ncbi:hypothetical protein D3C73_1215610 [compost metagenome]
MNHTTLADGHTDLVDQVHQTTFVVHELAEVLGQSIINNLIIHDEVAPAQEAVFQFLWVHTKSQLANHVVAAIQLDLPLTVDGCVGLFLTFEEIDLTSLMNVEAVRYICFQDRLSSRTTETATVDRQKDLVYVEHVGCVLVTHFDSPL